MIFTKKVHQESEEVNSPKVPLESDRKFLCEGGSNTKTVDLFSSSGVKWFT